MRELEDLADQATESPNFWKLWYEFSDEFHPIPNPANPTSYFYSIDDAALLTQFNKSQIWMVYQPWGQDLAEYSFITPFFDGEIEDLGDDGEGYIVTEKSWSKELDWTTSKYRDLEVKVLRSCECAGDNPDCEICEGQGPEEISCLEIESED